MKTSISNENGLSIVVGEEAVQSLAELGQGHGEDHRVQGGLHDKEDGLHFVKHVAINHLIQGHGVVDVVWRPVDTHTDGKQAQHQEPM